MTVYICKCNNCGNILYDENPQIGAEEKEIVDMVIYPMELLNNNGYRYWGCGECKTDEYLTDL